MVSLPPVTFSTTGNVPVAVLVLGQVILMMGAVISVLMSPTVALPLPARSVAVPVTLCLDHHAIGHIFGL